MSNVIALPSWDESSSSIRILIRQKETNMNLEDTVKTIRKIYSVLSGKSGTDVIILYKGNEYGVDKPWVIRIDSREAADTNCLSAATKLFLELKKELTDRIASMEAQTSEFKKALKLLDN